MIREWILSTLVTLIVEQLKKGTIQDVAHKIRDQAIPWLHAEKDELISRLRAKAKESVGDLDDAFVDAFEVFLTELLPSPQCLVPQMT